MTPKKKTPIVGGHSSSLSKKATHLASTPYSLSSRKIPKTATKHSANDSSTMKEADHRIKKSKSSTLAKNSGSIGGKKNRSVLDDPLDNLCPICVDDCTCKEKLSTEVAVTLGRKNHVLLGKKGLHNTNNNGAGSVMKTTTNSTTFQSDLYYGGETEVFDRDSPKIFTEKGKNAKLRKSCLKRSGDNNGKSDKKVQRKKEKVKKHDEEFVDKCAQYMLSEYYFSSSDLEDYYDEIINECSDYESSYEQYEEEIGEEDLTSSEETSTDKEYSELDEEEDEQSEANEESDSLLDGLEDALVMSKVGSVIGPAAWNFFGNGIGAGKIGKNYHENSNDDDEELLYFDNSIAESLIELPIPTPPPEPNKINNQSWSDQMAILTPQVLAAISAAAKTLNSGHSRRQLEYIKAQAESRSERNHYHYYNSNNSHNNGSLPTAAAAMATPTTATTTTTPAINNNGGGEHAIFSTTTVEQDPLKRWSRIPISAFRRRRPSISQAVMPTNAIRQMSVDSGMANCTLLSEPKPSNSAMIITVEEAAILEQTRNSATFLTTSQVPLYLFEGKSVSSSTATTCSEDTIDEDDLSQSELLTGRSVEQQSISIKFEAPFANSAGNDYTGIGGGWNLLQDSLTWMDVENNLFDFYIIDEQYKHEDRIKAADLGRKTTDNEEDEFVFEYYEDSQNVILMEPAELDTVSSFLEESNTGHQGAMDRNVCHGKERNLTSNNGSTTKKPLHRYQRHRRSSILMDLTMTSF